MTVRINIWRLFYETNQKTNLTVPVMTDPPGVIQPAPQIDYRSPGMGFQVILHFPLQVALAHGHFQRAEHRRVI